MGHSYVKYRITLVNMFETIRLNIKNDAAAITHMSIVDVAVDGFIKKSMVSDVVTYISIIGCGMFILQIFKMIAIIIIDTGAFIIFIYGFIVIVMRLRNSSLHLCGVGHTK